MEQEMASSLQKNRNHPLAAEHMAGELPGCTNPRNQVVPS
jgi:hypothetical protein